MLIIKTGVYFVSRILPLLIAIAFLTLYERHLLAALQRRSGPNVTGFYGILQALADGIKLFLKEAIIPKSANSYIFLLSPIITFGLAMAAWVVIPVLHGSPLIDFRLSILYIFAISSLSVHTIIIAGWSSNSKYAFLGGIRSAAQRISYEISIGATLLSLVFVSSSLNFTTLSVSQDNLWYITPLLPVIVLFFISTLAETNRHPFDLPEAESELVSGYNVEYSGIGFALFFLAEYSNIILIASLSGRLFIGGYAISSPILSALVFAIKTRLFISLFILVRGTLPRYRYDQLRTLGWKVFLPFALAFVVIYARLVLSTNSVIELTL